MSINPLSNRSVPEGRPSVNTPRTGAASSRWLWRGHNRNLLCPRRQVHQRLIAWGLTLRRCGCRLRSCIARASKAMPWGRRNFAMALAAEVHPCEERAREARHGAPGSGYGTLALSPPPQ